MKEANMKNYRILIVDDEIEYQDFVMRKPIFTMRERPIYTQMGQRRRFRQR